MTVLKKYDAGTSQWETIVVGKQGPQGPQGTQGAQGAQGSQGATGPQGAQGPQGTQGPTGPQGAQGPQGANGVTGAQGPQGSEGPQGAQGAQGATGPQGPQGAQGDEGPQGDTGPQGPQGSQGPQGVQGAQGAQGADGQSSSFYDYKVKTTLTSGDPGSTHYIYNNATQTSATQINISHLDKDNIDIDIFLELIKDGDIIILQDAADSGDYQKWEVTATPTLQVGYVEVPVTLLDSGGEGTTGFANNLDVLLVISSTGPQGPQGPQGAAGPQGAQGPQGVQGDTGPQGAQGDVGPQGATGAQGAQGPQGAVGPQGDVGPQGSAGATGAQGPQGDTGPQGPQGTQGPQGAEGESSFEYASSAPLSPAVGDRWVDSDTGIEYTYIDDGSDTYWVETGNGGYTGPQGPQGPQGDTGPQGPQGPAGDVEVAAAISTPSGSISNSETRVVGYTTGANTLTAGAMFRVTALAQRTGTNNSGATFRVRIGPTTLTGNIASTITLANTNTASPLLLEMWVGIDSTGSSGSTSPGGATTIYGTTSAGTTTTTVSVNTTVSNQVELTAVTASSANSFVFSSATIERVA